MQLRRLKLKDAPAVPLNPGDRALLTTIYRSRLRFFCTAILGLFLAFNFYTGALPPPDFNDHDRQLIISRYRQPVRYASPFTSESGRIWLIIKLGLNLFIFVPAFLLFRKRVWAYRKDLVRGEKVVLYERVAYKLHFPLTGQYFIALEDADYLHHEVDGDTHMRIKEGDLYPVYFAPFSHYAFNPRGMFSAL